MTPPKGWVESWELFLSYKRKSVHCFFNLVSPDYFRTLATPLLAGRDFQKADTSVSGPVAIVNESAARQLFPGARPIGHAYYDEVPPGEAGARQVIVKVVGLVKDAKYRQVREESPPTIYLPIDQNPTPFVATGIYELRFDGSAGNLVSNVKRAAAAIDSGVTVDFHLLSTQVADSLLQEKLLAVLGAGFGLLALVLAAVGVYGVAAYSVRRRRNEIGIRIALGAPPQSVLVLLLRDLVLLIAIGLGVGLTAAIASTRLASAMVYGLRPNDPPTLIGACVLLLCVAGVAGYLPARIATLVDPLAVLRDE